MGNKPDAAATAGDEEEGGVAASDAGKGSGSGAGSRRGSGTSADTGGKDESKGDADDDAKAAPAALALGDSGRIGSFHSIHTTESDTEDEDEADTSRRGRGKIDIRQYMYKPEEIEEIIMMSGLTQTEITKLFKRFFAATKHTARPQFMTKDVFLELPEIKVNPLRERLAHVFGFDEPQNRRGINFAVFVRKLSVFSERGNRGEKLKAAFQMHDLDGKNRITKQNLRDYLKLVIQFGEDIAPDVQEATLDTAVDSVFNETVGNRKEWLTYEDFRAVVNETEYPAKLMLHLI